MHLVKSPLNWTRLDQLTANAPDLPQWISLTELPLRQLTAGPAAAARIFYMPQQMPLSRAEPVGMRLAA